MASCTVSGRIGPFHTSGWCEKKGPCWVASINEYNSHKVKLFK